MSTKEASLFKHWITERHSIWLRRQPVLGGSGVSPRPWTTDPILAQYRFCNVYRQLDKVTIWLNKNWYKHLSREQLPFAACVARLINDSDSLQALKPAMSPSYDPKKFVAILNDRKAKGLSVRGAAYIVSTNGRTMPFPEYITQYVLDPLYAGKLDPRGYPTLAAYAQHLQTFMGIASFIAGQIVADLKYVESSCMSKPDWVDFVVPGPGSKRGLNRLHGFGHDTAMSDKRFHELFPVAFKLANDAVFDQCWPGSLHAQDVQNCLCEFDKYMRALTGQGKPKQRY